MSAHHTSGTGSGTSAGSEVTSPEPLDRRFRTHVGSVFLANVADGILLAGIPLVAVTLTRAPLQISMLQVAFWLPWLFLGVLAGVVVDRVDRQQLRMVWMGVRIAVMAAMAALAVTDQLSIEVLIIAVGIYGITQVFIDLAGSTMVPHLAPRSRWSTANGRVMGAEQLGNSFVGLPLGGVVFTLGAGWIFGVPAALGVAFLLICLVGMRGNFRAERSGATRPVQDVKEGLAFLLGHRVLRALVVSGGVMNMANSGYFAVFVLWAVGPTSAVQLQPEHFPLLLATLAVGALAASVTSQQWTRRFDEVPVMMSVWAVNTALLLVPVLVPHPAAIAAAFLVVGYTNMIGNVLGQTVRQRLVPAHLLGRTSGAARTLAYGLNPIGAALAGVVGTVWNLPAVFIGAVVLGFLGLLYPLITVRQRDVDALEVH